MENFWALFVITRKCVSDFVKNPRFKNQLRKARFTALNKIIKIAQMTYANVDSIGGVSASSLTILVAFIIVLYL